MTQLNDTNLWAEQERRELRARRAAAQRPLPAIRDRDWFVLSVSLLLLILAATVLIPGLSWLADGAPDNRPAAERQR